MPARRASLAALLLLGSACGGRDAEAPDRALLATADTIRTTLYEATAGAWLGGSRWAVLSPADQRVVILDFSDRSHTALGQGRPKAFEGPFALFTAGSTLYVADWALRRLTAWSRAGAYELEFPGPGATRGNLPRARDTLGHWYVQLNPSAGPDGSGNRDSATVVRYPLDFSAGDTILRLSPLDLAEVDGDAGRRFERRVFSGEDAWGCSTMAACGSRGSIPTGWTGWPPTAASRRGSGCLTASSPSRRRSARRSSGDFRPSSGPPRKRCRSAPSCPPSSAPLPAAMGGSGWRRAG